MAREAYQCVDYTTLFPFPAQNGQWDPEHAGDWQQEQDAAPHWCQRHILTVTCRLSGECTIYGDGDGV